MAEDACARATAPRSRWAWVLAGAVFALSVLPFAKSVRFGIVNCDDYDYANYPQLTNGVTQAGAVWAFTFTGEGIWMPLTWASYMVDYDLARLGFGPQDKFSEEPYHVMHAHSVLQHGLNAVLLFALLWGLAGRGHGVWAALAALFWAVHPLRCESVDWIASRKDVISMGWLLVALIGWVRWRAHEAQANLPKALAWYFGSVAACAVGACAKPSVMSYPILVAILDVFFLRRTIGTKDDLARMCVVYLAPFALALGVGYTAYVMQAVGGCTVEFSDMSFFGRALNAAVSFGLYILHTVLPLGLAPQCLLRWPHPPRMMVPSLVAVAAFAYVLWKPCTDEARRLWGIWQGKKGSEGAPHAWLPVVAGGLWYAVSIVPFLGLSGFGYHAQADRFTYIPAVGASMALLALARLGDAASWLRGGVLLGVTLVFGVLTARQTDVWRNDRTMWEQTVAVDGEANGVATAGLGLWYYEYGHDLKACIRHYDMAFALNTDYVQKTCFIYVDALAESGEMARAYEVLKWTAEFSQNLREQEMRIRGDPFIDETVKPIAHNRLARVACFLRDPTCAKVADQELNELVADMPKSIHVWYLVARRALLRGDVAAAEAAYRRITRLAARKEYVRYRFLADELKAVRDAKGK